MCVSILIFPPFNHFSIFSEPDSNPKATSKTPNSLNNLAVDSLKISVLALAINLILPDIFFLLRPSITYSFFIN